MANDGLVPVDGGLVQLTGISSRAWEHPADRGALVALRKLKGFDYVLRKLAGLWNERALRLSYLGSAVRVDEQQFAAVYAAYLQCVDVLDVPRRPELYVLAEPTFNAMAIGIDKPIVVITSGLVDLLEGPEELRFVLGHELGHVRSGHALYTTMLLQLMRISNTLSWVPLGALGLRAVIAALMEWQRKAELSGDRAGLLASQDPDASRRVHMKLASGGHLADLDVERFQAQGDEYLGSPDLRDSLLKLQMLELRSHPMAVVRAAELRRWVDDGSYGRILGGDFLRKDDDDSAKVTEEIGEATRHYSEAFERSQDPIISIVRDVGGGLSTARDKVSGWFGGRRDEPSDEEE